MLSASFWIVLPFILSFIWAGMIVIATAAVATGSTVGATQSCG